jgi:hypothetical protein
VANTDCSAPGAKIRLNPAYRPGAGTRFSCHAHGIFIDWFCSSIRFDRGTFRKRILPTPVPCEATMGRPLSCAPFTRWGVSQCVQLKESSKFALPVRFVLASGSLRSERMHRMDRSEPHVTRGGPVVPFLLQLVEELENWMRRIKKEASEAHLSASRGWISFS